MLFGPLRASAGLDPDPRRSVAAAIASREIRYRRAVHPRNLVLLLACAACPGDDKTTEPTNASGSSSGSTGDTPTSTDGASSDGPASSDTSSTSMAASTGGSEETAAPMTTAPADPCDECGPTEICVQEFDGFCGPDEGRCVPANGCVPPLGMSCPPECAALCDNFCGGSICDDGIPGALQCVGL